MRRRAWLFYLALGYGVLIAWEFVPGLKVGPVFNLIAISSPIAILVAVRMHRPDARAPWYLFALGQTFFVAGDIITYNYERIFGTELPYPSIGDVLYLSVYPCLIAGLLLLIRRRNPGRDRDSLIDSLIVAIGLGTLQWVFLMSPIAHAPSTDSTVLQKAVGMSYPFMDLMLVMAVVRLAIGAGKRTTSMYLMGGAALALFITDTVYSYISVQGIVYNQSGYLEAGWGTFYLLWGAAALHPSMRANSEEAPDVERRLSRPRLLLLAAASLMAPTVMLIQVIRRQDLDTPVLIGASAALFLLVVLRMSGLVRREEQAAQREKALREAGAALVTATNRASIYEATITAARRLAGAGSAVRMLVGTEGSDDLTVVAAAGGMDILGRTGISLSCLPEWKRERLESHRSFQVQISESQLAPLLGLPQDTEVVMSLPLFMKGELRGILFVASPGPVPRRTSDALSALVPQAALALDSAALTEDLLRRQSEARFSSLVQNSSDVVMVVDADSTIRYVSPSVERVLGYDPASLDATKLTDLIHPEDKAQMLQFLMQGSREDDTRPGLTESRMRHHGDFWLHVETLRTNLLHDPNVRGVVLNTRDVSERKAFEDQLAHQAFHDQVTGLANRALFKDRVEHALERQLRDDRPVSVLFMDLDDFKTINDSLGHDVGDRLLTEVGERLKASLRAADTAARMGGDEFAILLEDGGEGLGAVDVAARVLESLEGAFRLEGKEVFVRASIGIATAEPDHETPTGTEELLRNADVAMYMAKESGKGRYQVFEPAMHDEALKRLELKADLQRALDNDEFILHYQPVIELETGQINGLEALLRWQHPARGIVPPLDFIPLAEETGLIVPIGNWVLHEATRQGKALQQRYPTLVPPLHMAVNLSARQLQRPEIVAEVAEALVRSGLSPDSLVLEITESVMMRDIELTLQRLTELKEIGVQLAVDDFGIGYSSLNYIQQFPVDILKVDKSFVDAFNTDPRKSALTATIIELAEKLELRPVAEGIERADQLEQLLRLHCDLGQGFYFARPLPIDGIDDLLTARQTLASRDAELSS